MLQARGLWAKKQLGQNFLIDEMVFDDIVEAADLSAEDLVLEVGPGTGFLTERLLPEVSTVAAVEKDEDMVSLLKDRFEGHSNFDLYLADILKVPPEALKLSSGAYKVVANIPYYITSPLLKHFLQSEAPPSLMVLLVQKEVAEKICGISGKSLVTIETQLFGEPEMITAVPSGAFYPAPKVESAVLKIKVLDQPRVAEGELKDFLRLVKFGFSQKRKKLSNALQAGLRMKPVEIRALLESVGLSPEARAEELEIGDWKALLTKTKK